MEADLRPAPMAQLAVRRHGSVEEALVQLDLPTGMRCRVYRYRIGIGIETRRSDDLYRTGASPDGDGVEAERCICLTYTISVQLYYSKPGLPRGYTTVVTLTDGGP